MKTTQDQRELCLTVRHHRAINNATIKIGDITVLSGVNASGKSSIAHLFHSLVNFSASFESLAQTFALHQCDMMLTALSNMSRRVRMSARRLSGNGNISPEILGLPSDLWTALSAQRGILGKKLDFIQHTADVVFDFIVRHENRPDIFRYLVAFQDDLAQTGEPNIEALRESVSNELQRVYDTYETVCATRKAKVLNYAAENAVQWVKTNGFVELCESKECIFRRDALAAQTATSAIGEILSLDRAIYIESPWRSIPTRDVSGYLSVRDGLLIYPGRIGFVADRTLFSVLRGTVSESEDDGRLALTGSSSEWDYRREDGKLNIRLSDCATGIKSFSVLDILYERGVLDNRTLLVVDEPEVHLHPQWIFEYAKILVRLNRKLGVRLLITTHSPDMLNALKHVADVDQVSDLQFYLAEQVSDSQPFDFNYRSLGREVEPIFERFNYAMDMTDLYKGEQ